MKCIQTRCKMTRKDKTKDLLFNTIDYVVMIVIILGIVVILGHKFELLFNKGKIDSEVAQTDESNPEVNITNEDLNNDENVENDANVDANANTDSDVDTNTDENAESTKIDLTENTEENTDTNETEENNNEDSKPADTTPQATGEEVKITIPNGTLPGGIGEILASQGLVSSKEDFINKAVELQLDRKLRSGEFTFKKGQSLEEIIRTIAK
ncbi:endolytic transglycosylase MltG [Ezakiella peruensis]|uniref:endolytic transglycosylase MltG n=1 Tax=Ezakiella peruensis TaxID=1464038 RepID=UPI0011AFC43B|nr:endolytic transglycosylase MltG [Ezakiella peruensis]